MIHRKRRLLLACLLIFLGFPVLAHSGQAPAPGVEGSSAPPPGPEPMINAPPLKMVSPGVFEIGGCTISKKAGKVEFPATVNMDKGLLEYLIVESSGKVHESLLRTNVQPYSLQIALLLLGLEGTFDPLSAQGEAKTPEGDPLKIRLQWKEKGTVKEAAIEEWVVKGPEQKSSVGEVPWVFTGSVIHDGIFMAQAEKSIAALFHDPVALVDHQLSEGASDEIWFVNEKKVLPIGAEVTVVMEKVEK